MAANPWDGIDQMPWHDALIEALHMERSGEAWCIKLHCEIHPDEDLAYFQPFQLEQRKLIVHFNDIVYYSTIFRRFYESLNTYLDTWQTIREAQVIQSLLGE